MRIICKILLPLLLKNEVNVISCSNGEGAGDSAPSTAPKLFIFLKSRFFSLYLYSVELFYVIYK